MAMRVQGKGPVFESWRDFFSQLRLPGRDGTDVKEVFS